MPLKPLLAMACAATTFAVGQTAPAPVKPEIPVNYDEAQVGTYTLPDPLVLANGKSVRDARTWSETRRPELVRLFESEQYGRSPGRPADLSFDVFDIGTPVFGGKAIRKQVEIRFSSVKDSLKAAVLIYLPAAARKPVPLLLQISFVPNSAMIEDPGIRPGEMWNREKKRVPATESKFPKWKIDDLLSHGFGVATLYYGDIDPDFAGGLPLGVRALYVKPGETEPGADEWGSIAAWAWGLSRVMDYLETDSAVDSKRVALFGISRLGKTVLWAGAHDTRFAMVIASCSGEGGASLSRRNYGETVKHMNTNFGYQFARNYQKYGDHVDQLPVDSHLLLSLIAPRPLYLSTGDTDRWSDPKGEFLAAVAAGPVYRLLGKQGLGTDQMPAAGEGIMHTVGYHMHAGGHGTIPSDWDYYLKFLEMHFGSGSASTQSRP